MISHVIVIVTFSVLAAAAVALYLNTKKTFNYWKRKGVIYEKPIPFFGNVAANVFAKRSMPQVLEHLYWKYPEEKAVGFFRFSQPELLIRDPDIIKQIFTTDFHCFYSRGLLETEPDHNKLETLRKNVFVVEGDMWRLLRHGTSPAFTSARLRAMFPLVAERAERLQRRARAVSAGARPVDARDLMARYTSDFIAACGLGIDTDAQKKEDSLFRHLTRKIFHPGVKAAIVDLLKLLFPLTFKNFKHLERVEKEFCGLIEGILKYKNYKPSGRNDFIDVMLEIQAKGKIECKSMVNVKPDGAPTRVRLEVDDAVIAAQAFVFLGAGFETTSSATSYALHEIAYNPQVQRKIQDEVDRVLAKHNHRLSYDAIKEMHYLEWSLKEAMRIVPPVGQLVRLCRRKCSFRDLDVTVEEGTRVLVSLQAMHNDPKYWDSPEEFRPERFSPEINEPKHKFAYLPFGIGARGCIGDRMGLMQSLAGLAAILSRFSVAPAPASVRRPVIDSTVNLVQSFRGKLPLLLLPRTKTGTQI